MAITASEARVGCWSWRIDAEHRLIYFVEDDGVVVLQARYHYER